MATKRSASKTATHRGAVSGPKRGHAATRARVRMYRQGLGDCFLLTFPGENGEAFHMLIDCGVVLGTKNPQDIMRSVVENIAETTDNHINLLVATHEHWDHLSGFLQARDLFDKIHFDKVWLGWTENPADPLAAKLADERRTAEQALRMAAVHLGLAGDNETASRVTSMVEFFGAASSGTTRDALAYIKKRAGGKPKYCKPGEPPIELREVPGVRFWILGPPRDEKLIKKSNPSQDAAYGLDAGPGGSQSFFIAGVAAGMGATGDSLLDDSVTNPFDEMYSIPLTRAEQIPFFDLHYFGEVTDGSISERIDHEVAEVRDQSWRRIDAAWLGVSETMALQLDSATNNTSLVIAIELIDTGEILLFPGDAQAGNWMSWQNLEWDADEDSKRKATSGPDLLARTTFYKVGHHGSHNATLKALGLEMMTSSGICAMIPVDHAMAVKKRWGRMPLPELVDRLGEKTEGRILRVDDKIQTQNELVKNKPKGVGSAEWQDFTDRVTVDELFFELTF
jgi:hypothetical protein